MAAEAYGLTTTELDTIASYPLALAKLEQGTSPQRCLRVARAWLKDQLSAGEPRPHPTQYSTGIVEAIAERLVEPSMILDPMAGPMLKLRELEFPSMGGHLVWGIEIEPEWAEGYYHPRLMTGDATNMPFRDHMFDVIAVSPSYGNRFADRTGDWWDNADRPTYAGKLGRNVSTDSLCVPFHDNRYKEGHILAWAEAARVLRVGGMFFLNTKNFIRGGVIQRVSQWHREVLRDILQMDEIDDTAVSATGLHAGENYQVRAESVEKLTVFAKSDKTDQRSSQIRSKYGKAT